MNMKKFRYDMSGKWFKGNTHTHSTASDGGLGFAELAELYAEAGYAFLFATDHNVVSRLENDTAEYPLLWFDGIELEGWDNDVYYHVVCLGKIEDYTATMSLSDAMQLATEQNIFTILAHPFWSGNTLEDTTRWQFDGVEIYNHTCKWLNGKSNGRVHWNDMLRRNTGTLAFAADDTHLLPELPGWKGGWIVVNAAELSREAIMQAIRKGNYYSSCGPDFHNITLENGRVNITTSPVQCIRMSGPRDLGERVGSLDGPQITEASFDLSDDWDYAYLEIEDSFGKLAWTNTLFV